MAREFKISEESAQAQLELFTEWYGIDLDEMLAEADPKTKGAVNLAKAKVIKALRWGALEFKELSDNDGPTLIVEQNLMRPIGALDKIVYQEVSGLARASMKSDDSVNDTARMYQFLAVLSKQDMFTFHKLRGADIGVVDSLGFLFLMV